MTVEDIFNLPWAPVLKALPPLLHAEINDVQRFNEFIMPSGRRVGIDGQGRTLRSVSENDKFRHYVMAAAWVDFKAH